MSEEADRAEEIEVAYMRAQEEEARLKRMEEHLRCLNKLAQAQVDHIAALAGEIETLAGRVKALEETTPGR